jgi:hypothetical protein
MVERDGRWLRAYAASFEGLRRIQPAVAEVARLEDVRVEETAERRDPSTGSWFRVDLPSWPAGSDPRITEHPGGGPWGAEAERDRVEVRFELEDRDQAVSFAKALADHGLTPHRRGPSVFLFADDDRRAHELVAQLRDFTPPGAEVFYMGEGGHTFFV